MGLQAHALTQSLCPSSTGNGIEGQQWTQGSLSGDHSPHKRLEVTTDGERPDTF